MKVFSSFLGGANLDNSDQCREYMEKLLEETIVDSRYIQQRYHLSQSAVSRLYTQHRWAFAFKRGNVVLFLLEYAVPWFEAYNNQQNPKLSSENKKPRGRPKKPKGEFEYELFGSIYKGEGSVLQTETQWRLWLRDQYPQYFQPELNRDGWPTAYFELIHDLEGTLCPDYRVNVAPKIEEINRVFRQLEKAKK